MKNWSLKCIIFSIGIILAVALWGHGCAEDEESGVKGGGTQISKGDIQKKIDALPPAGLSTPDEVGETMEDMWKRLDQSMDNSMEFVTRPMGEGFSFFGSPPRALLKAPLKAEGDDDGEDDCPMVRVEGDFMISGELPDGEGKVTFDFGDGCITEEGEELSGKITMELLFTETEFSSNLIIEDIESKEGDKEYTVDGSMYMSFKGTNLDEVFEDDSDPEEFSWVVDVSGTEDGRPISAKLDMEMKRLTDDEYKIILDLSLEEEGGSTYAVFDIKAFELTETKEISNGTFQYGDTENGKLRATLIDVVDDEEVCEKNSIGGSATLTNGVDNVILTFHEECDGKAEININGEDMGSIELKMWSDFFFGSEDEMDMESW